MKTFIAAVAFAGLTSGLAFAAAPAAAPAPAPAAAGADTRPADHPCKKIEDACKAAGFVVGEHKEGKGLFMDCVQPIVKGQKVANVTVDPSMPSACAAKEAEEKAAKGGSATPKK